MFKDAVRAAAPAVEDRGIDEIYIDLTDLVMSDVAGKALDPWDRARDVGALIQKAVHEATALSCSIGVTPNKLLSKIASELQKPARITILREADIPTRVWPLPVRKVNGSGPKAGAWLEALGVRTVGELAHADPALLVEHFGRSYGARMFDAAKVEPLRPLVQPEFGDLPGVAAEEVKAMREAGEPLQIIDARPQHYVSRTQDIIEGAVWRDPERVRQWAGELAKSDPVVVFCRYGFDMGCKTAIALRDAGFDAFIKHYRPTDPALERLANR